MKTNSFDFGVLIAAVVLSAGFMFSGNSFAQFTNSLFNNTTYINELSVNSLTNNINGTVTINDEHHINPHADDRKAVWYNASSRSITVHDFATNQRVSHVTDTTLSSPMISNGYVVISNYPRLATRLLGFNQNGVTSLDINLKDAYLSNSKIFGTSRETPSDVYMYDIASATMTQLSTSRLDDGRAVATPNYVVWLNANGSLHSYHLGNRQVQTLLATNGKILSYTPNTTKDKLVLIRNVNSNALDTPLYNMYLLDIATQQETLIKSSIHLVGKPSMREDHIVWSDNTYGSADLYLYDTAANREIRLTNTREDELNPTLTANRIVYESNRTGVRQIYAYNLPFLTVAYNNPTGGRISIQSSPAGINCSGGNCSASFVYGQAVTLTAVGAVPGDRINWGTDRCAATARSCVINMDYSTITLIMGVTQPSPMTYNVSFRAIDRQDGYNDFFTQSFTAIPGETIWVAASGSFANRCQNQFTGGVLSFCAAHSDSAEGMVWVQPTRPTSTAGRNVLSFTAGDNTTRTYTASGGHVSITMTITPVAPPAPITYDISYLAIDTQDGYRHQRQSSISVLEGDILWAAAGGSFDRNRCPGPFGDAKVKFCDTVSDTAYAGVWQQATRPASSNGHTTTSVVAELGKTKTLTATGGHYNITVTLTPRKGK